MADKRFLICVTCPMGCSLEVTAEDDRVTAVEGQQCKRGAEYAQGEMSDPRRMVTTTVRIRGANRPLLPVHTAQPFPKAQITALADVLRDVVVQAPVRRGDIVLRDALGTGVDILASRTMGEGSAECAS